MKRPMPKPMILSSSMLLFATAGLAGCSVEVGPATGAETDLASLSQALPAPVSGSDIVAERAFVGDPLLGMGPGQAGNLYALNADDAAGMASTTKSFTLLLAVEAVEAGFVSLNDIVTISTKAADIDNNHSGGGHSEAGFPAGEQVRFEDLLYAMMLPSGGDASIAIAQHVAVSIYPVFAPFGDAAQEGAFVAMMNQRAEELGLDDTTFYNPYGGDHAHAADNTPGDSVPHVASTRDMARWFHFGMQYDLFRTVAGFQGTYSFNAVGGTAYSFSQSFGYPGIQGQKGGSNGACGNCIVADTRRIGRDLLLAYTQGMAGDGSTLLDYAFAELFEPLPQAASPEWKKGWVDDSLACVTGDRAASAVVQPNGTLKVLLWGLELDAGTIDHLNPVATPWSGANDVVLPPRDPGGRPTSVAVRPANPDPDPFQVIAQNIPDPDPDPNGKLVAVLPGKPPGGAMDDVVWGGKPPVVQAARIDYAGFGNLMVVAETDQGVYLYSFGITQNDTIVQRDMEFVGAGDDARVEVLHSTLVVTAHRNDSDNLTLTSFHLDPATGKLSTALDTLVGGFARPDELELAHRPGLFVHHPLVATFKDLAHERVLRSYQVTRSTGAITALDVTGPSGTVSQLALTRVSGFGTDRDIYALAFRNSAGKLVVESYELLPGGTLANRGSTTDSALDTGLSQNARIAISAHREAGVLVALQPNPAFAVQRLEVWALDASATSSSVTPNRIVSDTISEDGLHGMCRVPNQAAEGDFLMATGKPGVDGIELRAFRSGPRK